MTPTVLFVDDEINIIRGLRRSLRHMREEWNMLFANGGEEALSMFDGTSVDVVVSDMRMPHMDGASLLKAVQERSPRAIRMILSGQTSYEDAARLIGTCQQFLSKPCDAEVVIARVRQALSLRNILSDENLQRLLGALPDLPSPPEAYHKVMQELRNPSASIAKVADIVSQDVSLSAKLLHIARWGYFSAHRNITTVAQAVGLLGFERVGSLILNQNITNHYESRDLGGFSLADFNQHSMACAELAQRIATIEKMDSDVVEQAFVAGLLHDIGILVLGINKTDAYATLVGEWSTECRGRLRRETELFGGAHTTVGAYLAGMWGLPYNVVEAIAYHHTPSDCPSGQCNVLTAVHAAEALLQAVAGSDFDRTLGEALDIEYVKRVDATQRLPVWADLLVEQLRGTKDQ